MSSIDVLISMEVLEKLRRENESLKKQVEELKKRLEVYERPREELLFDPPLQFNRMKDYWEWIKEVEKEMH
jgi:hypothetical protein